MATNFSARDQALGYLYQARYALYLLLSDNEEREQMLEDLDDISFEDEGTPHELLQIKHHSNAISLTNASPEIWKTLRVWSSRITSRAIDLDITSFNLVTTAFADEDSIAAKLRPGLGRDTSSALNELVDVAKTSSNVALKKAFDAFLDLKEDERNTLVDSIYIIDNSPNIQNIVESIKDIIKFAVAREHRDLLYERLEGWWFSKVVTHLRADNPQSITGLEVNDRIRFYAEQFLPDALPIDFLGVEPERIDVAADTRQFVNQLKLIAVQNPRIEKAIIDYYRAFEQRSKWVREDLLIDDELEQYEKKLIDEWDRCRLALTDDFAGKELPERELQKIGRDLYNWVDQTVDYRIRPNVAEPYVMRGSYHILADKKPPKVGWHPKFIDRLTEILARSK